MMYGNAKHGLKSKHKAGRKSPVKNIGRVKVRRPQRK